MPANWELQLISTIVRGENRPELYLEAVKKGVTQNTFGNSEARTLWSGIHYHFNRSEVYGQVPSESLLKELYPFMELPEPQECFEDLCDIVLIKHQRRQVDKAWDEFNSEATKNTPTALAKLAARLTAIQEQANGGTDVDFSAVALQETVEELEAIDQSSGVTGIPFPWPRMNQATGGINEGDYILIYSLPKSMKTWLGLLLAVHVATTGRRVLVYSREMMWAITRRRIGCILAKADYTEYRTNCLSDSKKEQVLAAIDWFCNECQGNIIFTDADLPDGSPGGPDEIRRKIEVYKPHFVLLDSAYMLEIEDIKGNPYDWKSMALVNRKCKQIAKKTGVPIAAILQENERMAHKFKGTRGTASLAMNTSAIQDCDIAIRIVYHKRREEMSLHLSAARETTDPGFTIHAKAATNFEFAHNRLWEVDEVYAEEQEGNDEPQSEAQQALQDNLAAIPSMAASFRTNEEEEEGDE